MRAALVLCAMLRFSSHALAAEAAGNEAAKKDTNPIGAYLVDITGGAVSASNLVGVEQTAITQIETSQDLVVAVKPFASGDQKNGFGLAITPARTSLIPFKVSGHDYATNRLTRLLSNITLSYAQSSSDVQQVTYKKNALSVGTMFYLNTDDDPVVMASTAYQTCANDLPAEIRNRETVLRDAHQTRISQIDKGNWKADEKDALKKEENEKYLKARQDLTDKEAVGLRTCMEPALKKLISAKWNSSRVSFSYGAARIRGNGGESHSLGKSATLNVQFGEGPLLKNAALNATLRRTRNALDIGSLGKPSLVYKNSTLAAGRFTYGNEGADDWRAIAEVSNAKSSNASAINGVFKYAVGIDKKVAKGAWLEFRVGRSRSRDDGKEETTALMNVNISPTLLPFPK